MDQKTNKQILIVGENDFSRKYRPLKIKSNECVIKLVYVYMSCIYLDGRKYIAYCRREGSHCGTSGFLHNFSRICFPSLENAFLYVLSHVRFLKLNKKYWIWSITLDLKGIWSKRIWPTCTRKAGGGVRGTIFIFELISISTILKFWAKMI